MEWGVVLQWLAVVGALTLVGAPLAAWAFRGFPGKGATLALPAALLGMTLVTVWIGQVAFGWWTLLLAVLLVGVASAIAYGRGVDPDWLAVAKGFGVFLAGFAFILFVRASDPAITPYGGEQFLHFALAKSIERASHLPPEDVWFAGEPLRYYYGGQLQVSGLSMLSGVDLRYGFNLGIATFYGMAVAAAYGLVGTVTARAGYSRRLGGLLGVVLVAWGGATTTAIRFLIARLPTDLATTVGEPAFGFAASRFGTSLPQFIAEQGGLGSWSWWYTRYVVPDTLQEFPLYSFVKADLHGHALTPGYVLVAAAIAYAYYRTPAEERIRRSALLFGALGVVTGVFGVMNTWSVPTAVGLAWLAVAAADAHPASLYPLGAGERLRSYAPGGSGPVVWLAREAWRLLLAIPPAVGVGVVGTLLAAPFLAFGEVPRNGGIGFLPPRSPLLPFLVVYGGLLAVTIGFLCWRGAPAFAGDRRRRRLLTIAGIGVLAAPLLVVAPVLAALGPVIVVSWWLVRTDRAGYAGLLLVAGLGLLASMELVYAVVWPPELDRWNTTLKVAVQGWTLTAVGVAAAAAMLLQTGWRRVRPDVDGGEPSPETEIDPGRAPHPLGRRGARAAVGLVVAVLVASLAFPALVSAETIGATVQEGDEFALDGIEPLESRHGPELEAVRWLDDRTGRPVIVERPGWEIYQWTNPASTYTGLPTVAGWAHERGYRGIPAYERRAAEAAAVYEGSWANATAVLRRHDVRYVYVGPNEREAFGTLTERFAGRPGLSVAFDNEAVTIYRVETAGLASAASPGKR
jgi:YYY domain-containing protein